MRDVLYSVGDISDPIGAGDHAEAEIVEERELDGSSPRRVRLVGPSMTATIIDGKAIAAGLRARVAGTRGGDCRGGRARPGAGAGVGGVQSGVTGLREIQDAADAGDGDAIVLSSAARFNVEASFYLVAR